MGRRNRKEKGQIDLTKDVEMDVYCSLSVLLLNKLPAEESIEENMPISP